MATTFPPSFPVKDPTENVAASVDFSARLDSTQNETLVSVQSVTVTHEDGVADPTPSNILSGSATVSGGVVMQKFTGGVDGADYCVKFVVNTSLGQRLASGTFLSVRDCC